jgi:hypothetical protein
MGRSLAIAAGLVFVAMVFMREGVSESKIEPGVSEEDRLGARSDEYSRLFDKAISALVDGDGPSFRALLSSNTVLSESRGPGAVDVIIRDRFIPFFSDFVVLTDSITTLPTYDSVGNTGMAIARSFKTTGGESKSFVIYIVSEKGRMVVGNLLPNMTDKQLLDSRKGNKPK